MRSTSSLQRRCDIVAETERDIHAKDTAYVRHTANLLNPFHFRVSRARLDPRVTFASVGGLVQRRVDEEGEEGQHGDVLPLRNFKHDDGELVEVQLAIFKRCC